ncbi:hypothetical protein [Idiomarina aminovorans]|uniref:hypothetical protein n=1 Tax=Idiomarina aminovorans TaxID=2914829 RepID=UPI0020068F3F|nr:hypothetical protein [Idiomarina sp. ATCH4]MCK7459941.1 hypothetical protein [Idiomarina sp. ATCH4]
MVQNFEEVKASLTKIKGAIASLSIAVAAGVFVYFFTKDEYAVEVDIGFQVASNGDDLTSTIVIRNAGDLPLKNLRGEIHTTHSYNGSPPYFKPTPWIEPYFRWEDNTGLLTFNWPMMNPGEEVDIPAIYHSEPIYEWTFWIKADGVTFDDTIKCHGCNNIERTFWLSDASM